MTQAQQEAPTQTVRWPAVGDEVDIIGGPYRALRGCLGVVVSVEQYHPEWCRVRAEGRRLSFVFRASWLRPLDTLGEWEEQRA